MAALLHLFTYFALIIAVLCFPQPEHALCRFAVQYRSRKSQTGVHAIGACPGSPRLGARRYGSVRI